MNKEWIQKCIPAPVLIHKPSVKHGSHAVCVFMMSDTVHCTGIQVEY